MYIIHLNLNKKKNNTKFTIAALHFNERRKEGRKVNTIS
jgi:hypothetical protein